MPVYCYECPACGRVRESYFARAEEAPTFTRCHCGAGRQMRRSFSAEHRTGRRAVEGKWPLVSVSAGVHPKQIPELVRRHPDEVNMYDRRTGNVIFHSRQERRKFLKRHHLNDSDSFYGY